MKAAENQGKVGAGDSEDTPNKKNRATAYAARKQLMKKGSGAEES